MSGNPKLNDLQLVLLSTAAQRDDGSILPPAESIAHDEDRILKVIPILLKRRLVEEMPVKREGNGWRREGEQFLGVRLTDAGRAAISAEKQEANSPADRTKRAAATSPKTSPTPRQGSKAEVVLNLLRRAEGATLQELVNATGWQPHTTRAALTGLRKKGHVLDKGKRDEATCYRIARAA